MDLTEDWGFGIHDSGFGIQDSGIRMPLGCDDFVMAYVPFEQSSEASAILFKGNVCFLSNNPHNPIVTATYFAH